VISPEELGRLLGTSGPTVRRWEAGIAKPTEVDINHFAAICNLKPIEARFMLEAFSGIEVEEPPDEATFRHWALSALSVELPSYIFDSLFYVRASNHYRSILSEPPHERRPIGNMLAALLKTAVISRNDLDLEKRLHRWLRDFWSSTASLCGSTAYRATLEDLRNIEGFEERWRDIALNSEAYLSEPVGTPYRYCLPPVGDYLVITTAVTLPPVYYLRQYIPMNEVAQRRVESLRSLDRVDILFSSQVHWSANVGYAREPFRPAVAVS
jgi:transcriptional regulator with XRE-family HTH domain